MQDSFPQETSSFQPAPPELITLSDIRTVESPQKPRKASPPRRVSSRQIVVSRLSWLTMAIAFLLVSWYIGPWIVEEYQYRYTLAKQRAEYEAAREALESNDGSPLNALSVYYQQIAYKVGPSVVHINTVVIEPEENKVSDDDTPPHPRRRSRQEVRGQGSGVIVDDEGYIVTNHHVIEGSSEIKVLLRDKRQVTAKVVGWDEDTDLAVLKIEADELFPAEWGDSDDLEIGSLVWAMGSPFGLQQSVTHGVLSGKHRETGLPLQDFLQTDAAVNPGNSGGPLVNDKGEVVGINTAIVAETYQGISFAIPSNVVRDVFEQIKENSEVARGWFGVRMVDMNKELSARLDLQQADGVMIAQTVDLPGMPSPARVAGIQEDDIVIRWNGAKVDSSREMVRQVARTKIGSTATVVVIRDGMQMEFSVTVEKRPVDL